MNLLERVRSWQNASPACKAAFIDAMTEFVYNDQDTLHAWNWFYKGWESNC